MVLAPAMGGASGRGSAVLGAMGQAVVEGRHPRATEEELKQFSLANGPAYQHPRRVFFLPQLPLAGTNKIDQPALRRWAADQLATAAPE